MRVNTLFHSLAMLNGAVWVGRLPREAMQAWRQLRRHVPYSRDGKSNGLEVNTVTNARIEFIAGHIEFHTGTVPITTRRATGSLKRLLAVATWDGHVAVVDDLDTRERLGTLLKGFNYNWRPVWTT